MHSFGELSLNVKIFFKLLRTKLKTLEKLYMKVQNKKDLQLHVTASKYIMYKFGQTTIQWKLNTVQ